MVQGITLFDAAEKVKTVTIEDDLLVVYQTVFQTNHTIPIVQVEKDTTVTFNKKVVHVKT